MLLLSPHYLEVFKYGILEVNNEGIVEALIEKPKSTETTSRKAVRRHYMQFYTLSHVSCDTVSSLLFTGQTITTIIG